MSQPQPAPSETPPAPESPATTSPSATPQAPARLQRGPAIDRPKSNVFISYSRRNKDFMQRLYAALSADRRDVWVDWEDIPRGEDWLQEIYTGIENADTFVFIVSEHSLLSEVCNQELHHAFEHNKRVLPVIRQDIDRPTEKRIAGEWFGQPWEQMARTNWARIKAINWIFARPSDDFDEAVKTLLTTIDQDLDYIKQHTRLHVRARQWEASKHDADLLLRGSDLQRAEAWLRRAEANPDNPPTDLHREFIRASRRSQRRRSRLVGAGVAVALLIAALAILAGYLAVVADDRRQEASTSAARAREAQREAQGISLAAQAQLELTGAQPERSVLLALAALDEDRFPYVWQAERALGLAVQNSPARAIFSGHTGEVMGLDVHPTSGWIVSAGQDGDLRVWEPDGTERLMFQDHQSTVFTARWAPESDRVASSAANASLIIWDALSGTSIHEIDLGSARAQALSWSPDGAQLAVGLTNGSIQLYDTTSAELLATLPEHTGTVTGLAWSPDGRRILSTSDGVNDRRALVWDTTDLSVWYSAQLPEDDFPLAVAWSPDGQGFAVGSSAGLVHLWGVPGDYVQAALPLDLGAPGMTLSGHLGYVAGVAWSPDGGLLATASTDRTVRVWEVGTGNALRVLRGHSDDVNAVAWMLDGTRVISGGRDGDVRMWDAAIQPSLVTLGEHADDVSDVAYSPDGAWLATSSLDRTVRVWDAGTGDLALTLVGHDTPARTVTWSPDGQRLVSGDAGGQMIVWDLAAPDPTADEARTVIAAHDSGMAGVAWSPDGTLIATASNDSSVKVWDAVTLRPVRILNAHNSRVTGVDFAPDSARLVSSSWDRTAIVWDMVTGEPLVTLRGHQGFVYSAAFAPDGERIVTASADDTARVWDTGSGDLLVTLVGHTERVNDAAWSLPDGARIVTASLDRTARLWNATSGNELITLAAHADTVYAVDWSPGGTRVVTASADATARLWRVWTSTDELETLARACCVVRDLTDAERAQFNLD